MGSLSFILFFSSLTEADISTVSVLFLLTKVFDWRRVKCPPRLSVFNCLHKAMCSNGVFTELGELANQKG